MRVGFLNNQLDNRGTGNAMFDYAKYNRDLLGNESQIYTFTHGQHSKEMMQKYHKEFGSVYYLPNPSAVQQIDGVDVLYHIKYGTDDGIRTNPSVRYGVHSVFTNSPHGDVYATVSSWLSRDSNTQFVPHIVTLPNSVTESYRKFHDIPETAIVFGRYGGYDTFDISWVWDVMEKILEEYNNTWFIFANTQPFLKHPRVIYREELFDPVTKAIFVNTCDYMLHARHRGETFGIAVGEFASRGKPIITYGLSGERAHIELLSHTVDTLTGYYPYNDQFDLYRLLTSISASRLRATKYAYTKFKPSIVMKKFQEVFLS